MPRRPRCRSLRAAGDAWLRGAPRRALAGCLGGVCRGARALARACPLGHRRGRHARGRSPPARRDAAARARAADRGRPRLRPPRRARRRAARARGRASACASRCGRTWPWRCTAPGGRWKRSTSCARPGVRSPTSSASTRARGCRSSSARSCITTRRSASRPAAVGTGCAGSFRSARSWSRSSARQASMR